MTSRMDQPLEKGSSLPALREGQQCLTAPSHTPPLLTPRQRAAQWTLDTRQRLKASIERHSSVANEDLQTLKQELIAVLITALQQDSRSAWVFLHEILSQVEPLKDLLDFPEIKAEIGHYLERILHHAELHKERLFDLQISDSLAKVFPKEVNRIKQLGLHPAKNYCVSPPQLSLHKLPTQSISMMSPKRGMHRTSMLLPDNTNPYSTELPRENEPVVLCKPLTVGDIRGSIAGVAMEMAARESIWSHNYGTVTTALGTEIPLSEEELAVKYEPSPPKKRSPDSLRSSTSSLHGDKKDTFRGIKEEKVPNMTGREAVEYFAKLHHVGKIQSIYFNIVENRHFRPYDLQSVVKNKANPEHYIFSTFGVLHVYPDQPNVSLSLSDWQREAVLWSAISSIPFFKNFLIRKSFCKWRYTKKTLDIWRKREQLTGTLLHAIPAFGAALLQVSRLLKELITVNFLPFDDNKTYMLSDFENYINYKNIQAEKFLEKFFRYCKMVVDVTAEESFKKLKHCEEQVKKKTVFSKDSLHLQRIKKESRAENLRKARCETGRLGNFVKLVDQIIVEHMFSICKNQVSMFVEEVLKLGPDATRDGFFRGNLIFTRQDVLGLHPPKEKFIRVLSNTLRGIPTVLCANAIPIDGSIPDHETVADETESSAPTKSDAAKSVDNMRVMTGRRKSVIRQGSQNRAIGETPGGETTAGETADDADSQAGITRSIAGEEGITVPDLPRQVTITKEDDELGVATPDLVVKTYDEKMAVTGEGFMGQYEPLTKANLEDKLDKDAEFQRALNQQSEIINEALEEIDQYCERSAWLNSIYQYCKKWNDKSLKEFKGMAAYTIEQRLTELRQWSEKVRHFDKFIVTDNGLFYVDCIAIHEELLPRLNEIYQEVVTFVAEEAKSLAATFCEEMKEVLENMKDKRPTVDAFATFAKNFTIYKKNAPQYQQRMEYIKSLFEVIRMGYRQLTVDEEKYEENVSACGEAFLLQMQDASEFVNTQTPLMTKLLEDTFQKLEKQVTELSEKATTGKFLDTNQDPSTILMEMRVIREEYFEVVSKLRQASRWREAICGEAYNLEFLEDITTKMNVRQEVWKYVEITRQSVKDWKSTLFRKMNIKKALEKLIEWQSAASQLKPFLPPGDQVLSTWFMSLQEFKKTLPILHKLANEALKERHWKAIFVGMNENYDPNKQFTVADLLAYDLEEHAQLIHTVYLGAIAEFDLEVKLNQIAKLWEEREFKLAKHIPDSVLSAKEPKKPSSPRRRSKLEKYRQERAAAQTGQQVGLKVADDDFFILIEIDDLKYQLQHSRISIKSMMQSPFLGDMSQEVEYWYTALKQVEEVTDLWLSCQHQWLYLLKIFERVEYFKKFQGNSQKFEAVHNKFKDWMRVVSNDSKVLTVVHRKRGEKGYRLLQGDNLRHLFLHLIQQQEEILKDLDTLMESVRLEFPRLYFLSNQELVELLGVSRNPKAMLPIARKCFTGIESLTFALPPGTTSISAELDFALNADKLEVTTIIGKQGEELRLSSRISAFPKASKWLKTIENVMKNTTAFKLQNCLRARLDDGCKQPIQLLEELQRLKRVDNTKPAISHWMLSFPSQCVQVADAVIWTRAVNKCFDRSEQDDFKLLRESILQKHDQFAEMIRESQTLNIEDDMKTTLQILLRNLINQNLHHRDVVEVLASTASVSDKSFEWLRELKYNIDIQSVLRAEREELEVVESAVINQVPTTQRKPGRYRRTSMAQKGKQELAVEETQKLNRTRTVISTDYQFGPCILQHLGTTFNYDYEYLGPVSKLVLTPLTERAFLSLSQSLKYFHFGTLVGPAGIGKSATIKELAKMMGRNLFTVNCNEEVTLGMITQIMMGTVQSGCWTLFDDTNRLSKGLMSVAAQHMDYLRTALRTLQQHKENQYTVRGQPRFDKKIYMKNTPGDTVIRRNSLTTLHPLPTEGAEETSYLQRQKTVPHGFNEKGLVTYFQDTWISEKEQRRRRHSIEREVEIKESDLYKSNRPPPLFYEHVKSKLKKHTSAPSPDFSVNQQESIYSHHYLGNITFCGKLMQASANFGCFMTISNNDSAALEIPEVYRLLLRPCAMIIPDIQHVAEAILWCNGFQECKLWAKKLAALFRLLRMQLPRRNQYQFGLKNLKTILSSAGNMLSSSTGGRSLSGSEPDSPVSPSSPTSTSLSRGTDVKSREEQYLVQTIREILYPSLLNEDDQLMFNNIMRDMFPMNSNITENLYNSLIHSTVIDQLREDSLTESKELITRMMQLNMAVQSKNTVILTGPAGSGKTTCCTTLARAYNRLNYLLFAPDHSKDELTTEKDFVYHSKLQKISDIPDADDGEEGDIDSNDEDVLQTSEAKPVEKKAASKLKKMTRLIGKVKEAVQDLIVVPKSREVAEHPKVDVVRLSPTAMSPSQFLGCFSDGLWHGGLFPKILKDSSFMSEAVKNYITSFKDKKSKVQQEIPSILLRWIVLDGVMHPMWTESLNTMFDEENKLSLANCGRIHLEDTTALMFETGNLKEASPATIAQCTVLYFSENIVPWKALFDNWIKMAKSRYVITHNVLKVWNDLVQDIFGPTIKFLRSECSPALFADVGQSEEVVAGIQEVTTFLRFMTALLDKSFLREELEKKEKAANEVDDSTETNSMTMSRHAVSRMTGSSYIELAIPHYLEIMKGIFTFSYVWSFGGHIHERYKDKFSKFVHDALYRTSHPVRMPLGGLVFDYCLEEQSGTFIRWSDKQQERMKVLAGGFTLTTEVEKYTYLIDLMLTAKQPILLAGMPGVGKTSLIQNMVIAKHASTSINMSQGMSSAIFQNTMIAQIRELKHKASNTLPGPGTAKSQQHHLFFVDDLNTAQSNGAYQPPLDLLKQVVSEKGIYDLKGLELQDMEEAHFLCATTLPCVPGSGMGRASQVMSSRLTRQFVNITMFTPPLEGLLSMYGRNLQNWLEEFPTYSVEHHFEFSRAMALGLLEIFHRIKEKFKPTPINAHYVFSLHDISRVVHGILLMSPRSRTRKMMRKKKDGKESKNRNQMSRQQSWESRSRTTSVASGANVGDSGGSAPMMRVIAQLWCHECCRTFGDRLVSEEDQNWFSRMLEDTVLKCFCVARDDPKSEMAAISEETVSQTGRVTPPMSSPVVSSASEDEEEGEMKSEPPQQEVDHTAEEKEPSPPSTQGEDSALTPTTQETSRGDNADTETLTSVRTRQFSGSDTISTRQAGGSDITSMTTPSHTRQAPGSEVVSIATTSAVTSRRAGESEKMSESEYDTDVTEESSEEETTETETETDTIDTPRDTTDKKQSGAGRRPSDRESSGITESSTHSTDTSVERATPGIAQKTAAPSESGRSSGGSVGGLGGKVSTTPSLKHQGRSGGLKMKTVTFKAGLLADWEHEAYFGPLMSLDEVKGTNDSLTDFIFSKFFMTTHTETTGVQVEKGYVDSQEDVLAEALYTCLNVYNTGTSQRLELVFFSEALRHIARLSRVLAIQGGHALLLGMTYSTGRATLVRLASYIAHCKLFEPKPQTDVQKNHRIVLEHIKRACYHTGILGKPTTLLIHEDLGTESLQDVCCLMAEGTSPGLYTEDEIQAIVSQMMPGGVQTKRVDKIEQAFERYLKKIRQNLHVIVCLNYKGNNYSSSIRTLHEKLGNFPGLLKYSCSIDVYQPWSYQAYVKIANVWLRDQKSKISIPWHPTRMLDQMTMTSQAMAYIHLSAKNIIERQFCHQREPLRFYSPLTFMEFVHLFRVISAFIVKREKENIGKHEQALAKVNEAFGSINEFKREVSALTPQHKAAIDEIHDLVTQVEEHKQDYIEALDKCKEQETKIEDLQGPLEELRKEAQAEFDRVNPNYQAALTALSVLHKRDLEEVKAFREPPEVVQFVMGSLCLLFGVPQSWESAKLLLIKENVVEEMMFYDKDNIPDHIFRQLGVMVQHPLFDVDSLMHVSKATAGIAMWIHAVHRYAHIHRNMQPRLKNLLEQEEKFTQSQAKLGQLRVEANRIKSSLEDKIVAHKAAVKRAKTIERHMQSIEKKIARACNLMEHMSMQHYLWKSELKKARNHVLTAPGDALVTSACVLYHGPLEDKFRAELIQDWLDRCRQGNFAVDKHFGQERYPLSANLDSSYDAHKESEVSSTHAESTNSESVNSGGITSLPEICVYRYPPAVYDTRKYYKSELKKQGSIEYDGVPSAEFEDSDDEDEHSILLNRTGYVLQDILSDFDELSRWRLDNLPTDLHSVQNALLMRVSCYNRKHCWPLLIDPDNQAEIWVKTLQTSSNIFSEKDLRSGTPEESEGIPIESIQEDNFKQINLNPLPPSRGTGLTFSDVNLEYYSEDTYTRTDTERTGYTSSTITTLTDYHKSAGRHSRQTWNSEELRPVTSITNSWETFSVRAESNVEHPQHNLWIVEADDPTLESKLINAIVHGITILITHLERKPLDPLFRGLLLKQFFFDKDGNKIIKVGNYQFQYHPNFCLYLSTSVPLFLKGDGLFQVPIHRLCIINLVLSDEAIINNLLIETMKVERKEFEGQRRSNENDIILHRQRLAQEHELIREKTLNLHGPLLEDKTMLESLLACQKEVEKNRLILEETRFMGDHLEEKFAHYMNMIMYSVMIYNMIRRMSVLHNYYYLPLYKYMEIYVTVMKSRYRGKGSTGAPQARAQELQDAMSNAVFNQVSLMMFEQHFTLLQLMIAMESMRMNRKTSSKELSLFINGFEKQGLDETALLETKPDWISSTAWVNCIVLEQLHHPYHGLRRSLLHNSQQWMEYFKHPVSLMNSVPGSTLQELSVMQKCILWKIVCPSRAVEVSTNLTLYELGNLRKIPENYNIREVYNFMDKNTPAVFILPSSPQDGDAPNSTNGLTYVTPSHEIKRLAKQVGMDGKVKVLNFGVKGQAAEVQRALEECLQNGYWLLLQNYHMSDKPQRMFFNFLKEIVYSKWSKAETNARQMTEIENSTSVAGQSKSIDQSNQLQIHDSFRLWITTQADQKRYMPGVLVQHGVKVTCEQTGNFKAILQKSYRSAAFLLSDYNVHKNQDMNSKCSQIMPIALLHAVLLHQNFYSAFTRTNYWTLTDLGISVDALKQVRRYSGSVSGIRKLVSKVYYDCCTDVTDAMVVEAIVSALVTFATTPNAEMSGETTGVLELLQKLLRNKDNFQLKRAVDMLETVTGETIGLPASADVNLTEVMSSVLTKDLIQVNGAPDLFQKVITAAPPLGWFAEAIFPQITACLQKCAILPASNKNHVYPLDIFLHNEVEGYRALLHTIQSDLACLQRRAKGEILLSKNFDHIINALSSDHVPAAWLVDTFPSCSTLTEWISVLPKRIQTLLSYIDGETAMYNLSVFLRPDRFLEAVKLNYARKHFKDVNSIDLDVQVMAADLIPSFPPKDGIFVSGLNIHNASWDSYRGTLTKSQGDMSPTQEMPVLWMKPTDISSPSDSRYHSHPCPVYCSDNQVYHGDKNIVTVIPLPSLAPPTVWHQARVFMSCSV